MDVARCDMITNCVVLLQLERHEVALRQATTDMTMTRRQYQDAVEENGRLEARIQAFTFSAHAEQTQLSNELRRREDALQKLHTQQVTLQQTIGRQQQQVHFISFIVHETGANYSKCITM